MVPADCLTRKQMMAPGWRPLRVGARSRPRPGAGTGLLTPPRENAKLCLSTADDARVPGQIHW
jgi:hypothetical protein